MTTVSVVLAVLAVGCGGGDATGTCSGPGMLVEVTFHSADLADVWCALDGENVMATFGPLTSSRNDIPLDAIPRLVPWPDGVAAGTAGALAYSGYGDKNSAAGMANVLAQPTRCVVVKVDAACCLGCVGADAGVPDSGP